MDEESNLTKYLVPTEEPRMTRIALKDEIGRVIISNQSFEFGSLIIREKPVVVWDGDFPEFLEAFLQVSKEDQDIILDMYSEGRLNRSQSQFLLKTLFMNPQYSEVLGKEKMEKLFHIVNLNAHQYYGTSKNEYKEIFYSSVRNLNSSKCALFAYASKVSHSCLPNVSYSSKNDDGCLEYKVLRGISSGDEVTFSYIDKLFSTPTFERRLKLQDTKDFFCKCPRCMAHDDCRAHKCPEINCKEYVSCTYNIENGEEDRWECPKCGILEERVVKVIKNNERLIESRLSSFQRALRSGGISNLHPHMMHSLLKDAEKLLSRTHYLVLRILEETSLLCASHAAGIQNVINMGLVPSKFCSPYGTHVELRLNAAVAGLELVSRAECVAAGCKAMKCDEGKCVHPPVYEHGSQLFHSYQDLKHVPYSSWPEYAKPIISRYVPLLYLNYGENDSDVKEIEEVLKNSEVDTKKPSKKGNKKNQREMGGKKRK